MLQIHMIDHQQACFDSGQCFVLYQQDTSIIASLSWSWQPCLHVLHYNVGLTPEDDKQAKADQLHLLAEAEEFWSKAQTQAANSRAASVLAILASLQAGSASLRKLVDKPLDKTSEVRMQQVKLCCIALLGFVDAVLSSQVPCTAT